MGQHDGGQTPVDSSGWKRPVSSIRDGETHPEPARSRLGRRKVTPDPYITDNPNIRRNFGRKKGDSA